MESDERGRLLRQIRDEVLRFNGGLFAEQRVLPLDNKQLNLLSYAAEQDWRDVEPAIFGTLLERALDPDERHKLGAHYTPRAYVERLVMPTVIEPLRKDWEDVRTAAFTLDQQGKRNEAIAELRDFHRDLCKLRVLDPACGSGNFLYVTLEHLKRLEGEIFNALDDLGDTQHRLEETGVTVDPHQMLGLESNPRAARIAEAVLWIGYLQWHYRTRGEVDPPEPVLKDFHNIEHRDAVLAWDRVEYVTDEKGIPVTRWDGKAMKRHPVTGKQVPDETAQILVERYVKPRKAKWPEADFMVGNPPYLGARTIRLALGDGYLKALRGVYTEVPENADYVMYWWDRAADLIRSKRLRQFGFITTNSIRQSFSQSVLVRHMAGKPPLHLAFAIPDHPWVDSADGAAVRVAITTGTLAESAGVLQEVRVEEPTQDGECKVSLRESRGVISPSLHVGAALSGVVSLRANGGLSCVGYQLTGTGFVVSEEEAAKLDSSLLHPLLSGRDIVGNSRVVMAIDACSLEERMLRDRYPATYQHLLNHVKPERDHNNRASVRDRWWVYGEARNTFRPALEGVSTATVTSLTAKHRLFISTDSRTICDSTTVMFAVGGDYALGVLSSRTHIAWALAVGSTLEDRPRYNKTRCFETFPFPEATEQQRTLIGDLAEQIDVRRKKRQELYPKLKLTDVYNVLEKLRAGEELTDKDRQIHEQGLVTVLAELHDELDAAVLEAYGWSDLAPALVGKPGGLTPSHNKSPEQEQAEEILLQRLVALNAERAAEEARGKVRWLRPEFQDPKGAMLKRTLLPDDGPAVAAGPAAKRPWPKPLAEQFRALREVLAEQRGPAAPAAVARQFKSAQTRRVAELLATLESLGQAREAEGRYSA